MFTILGGDGKEYGPVTLEQIRSWIAAGRANLDTKTKAAGSEEWRRIGDLVEFGGSIPTPPPLTNVTPATGATIATLSAPARLSGSPQEIASRLIANAGTLDVFSCVARSFELWKSNFLPLVGVTLLLILVQMALGMIPFLGAIAGMCLGGVFHGGLYYYYLGKMRGEHREVGDVFAGFSKAFVPLLLASLLTTALTIAVMIPFFAPWGVYIFNLMLHSETGGMPAMPGPFLLLVSFVGFLVLMYFSVSWSFTFALVMDRKLGPWTALEVSRRVVTRQWFRVFCAMLLGIIVTMLGLFGLFIGIFLTIPLMIGTILYAYEDLCTPPDESPAQPIS